MRLPFALPFTRLLGPGLTVAGVLALAYVAFTGRLDLAALTSKIGGLVQSDSEDPEGVQTNGVTPVNGAVPPGDTITIATFNIQKFGRTKSDNKQVMQHLAWLCSYFDLVAIQEALSPDANPVGKLVQAINEGTQESNGRYEMIVSEPIGRTTYREQYAFIFNSSRVRPLQNRAYVMDDSQEDRMHREPLVATFQAVLPPDSTQAPFTFTIINAHTDPDEVGSRAVGEDEIQVLADIYQIVRQFESSRFGEDDFILVGDLNASRDECTALTMIPQLRSVAPPGSTMVRGKNENDHIVVNLASTREFTGQASVVDLQNELNLTQEQALLISDHQPVWAAFSAAEASPASPPIASFPGVSRN